MSNLYKEQRPLLCDDWSDEEFDVKSYYQRRNRPSVRSGRARNYAKGAAAVLTRWPDHCSTSVAYWWIGVSMIAIIVFVIYNSVLIFGMLPASDVKQPKYRIFNNEIKIKPQVLQEVYMHLIIHNSTGIHLKKYLPYAAAVSKKYPSFKYRFIVLLNDTIRDFHDYNDEERNEIALNSLWKDKKMNQKISSKYNISVEYLSLTEYLNDSPIKKFWRHLPPYLIEFLVRPVSIWEKGGIAFNPKILVPSLYNPHYIEKLYNLLNNYANSNSISTERNLKAKINPIAITRRPNNIQDIINNLEKDNDDNNNMLNIDLSEAENNINVVPNTNNILKVKGELEFNSGLTYNNSDDLKEKKHYNNELNHPNNYIISNITNVSHTGENMLPLFLKYLFQNKPEKLTTSEIIHLDITKNNTSLFDGLISLNQNQSQPPENVLKIPVGSVEYHSSTVNSKSENSLISNKQMPDTNLQLKEMNKYDNNLELSLDIKGNIIASRTACHAFLGTMFTNVIQHVQEETMTDFIIFELSIFCNGLLSSCAGVNVILV